MCLSVQVRKSSDLDKSLEKLAKEYKLIAKKDIVVYKVVRSAYIPEKQKTILFSLHKGFKYEEGFHYYQKGKKFGFYKGWNGFQVHQGLHSFVHKPRFIGYGQVILKCIIPKGSTYYSNNCSWLSKNEKEYVSDNLIIVKQVK